MADKTFRQQINDIFRELLESYGVDVWDEYYTSDYEEADKVIALIHTIIGEDLPTPDTAPNVNLDHNLVARNIYNNELKAQQRAATDAR